MILSFDLDGVVANTDNGLLVLLHQAVRDGKPGAEAELRQYYARRAILLDPRQFTGPVDELHIITGRVPTAHSITHLWVERHFGALPTLHLVGTPEVEVMFAEGDDARASWELAKLKLEVIRQIRAQVHFDNNPIIVKHLRVKGVTAVMVGGGLL